MHNPTTTLIPTTFLLLLLLLLLPSPTMSGVIRPRVNDIMIPIKSLPVHGFRASPDGTNDVLAGDNVIRCNRRQALPRPLETSGLEFNEESALASRNSLVYMLEQMSKDANASFAPDSTFSQECKGAGASISNFGPVHVEIEVPIFTVKQALGILIDQCVKEYNMTGSISSRHGIQIDVTEWPSEERCGAKFSARGLGEKTRKRSLLATVLAGLLGFITHILF